MSSPKSKSVSIYTTRVGIHYNLYKLEIIIIILMKGSFCKLIYTEMSLVELFVQCKVFATSLCFLLTSYFSTLTPC